MCFQKVFEVIVGCKSGLSIIISVCKVVSFILFHPNFCWPVLNPDAFFKKLLRRLCAVIKLENDAYNLKPHTQELFAL